MFLLAYLLGIMALLLLLLRVTVGHLESRTISLPSPFNSGSTGRHARSSSSSSCSVFNPTIHPPLCSISTHPFLLASILSFRTALYNYRVLHILRYSSRQRFRPACSLRRFASALLFLFALSASSSVNVIGSDLLRKEGPSVLTAAGSVGLGVGASPLLGRVAGCCFRGISLLGGSII